MKNKYDSSVMFLYGTGNEHLLPEEFRKIIPYSTISGWRKMDYCKYLGHEFRYLFDDAAKMTVIHNENEKLRRMLFGLGRSWCKLSPQILEAIKRNDKDDTMQGEVVECVKILQGSMGLDCALKLFGLTMNTYNLWSLRAHTHCQDSFLSICVKRHPQQLHRKEIFRMVKMLRDPEFQHWPIASIAAFGQRNGMAMASLRSWYRYARRFNITRKTVRKHKKRTGLQASCPNEYLHVDITEYAINERQTLSIAFVMDNYSKMILGYHVSEGAGNFALVKEALKKALEVIMTHPDQRRYPDKRQSYLVADGGSENHNTMMDEFISELSGHKLTKIRALKDIAFSNSPVESIHRTLKSRYLRNRKFETLQGFLEYLAWAVADYNDKRPHYRHGVYTPSEVYFNENKKFNMEVKTEEARQARVKKNKCTKCKECQVVA